MVEQAPCPVSDQFGAIHCLADGQRCSEHRSCVIFG